MPSQASAHSFNDSGKRLTWIQTPETSPPKGGICKCSSTHFLGNLLFPPEHSGGSSMHTAGTLNCSRNDEASTSRRSFRRESGETPSITPEKSRSLSREDKASITSDPEASFLPHEDGRVYLLSPRAKPVSEYETPPRPQLEPASEEPGSQGSRPHAEGDSGRVQWLAPVMGRGQRPTNPHKAVVTLRQGWIPGLILTQLKKQSLQTAGL